jgi:hypothetical protein
MWLAAFSNGVNGDPASGPPRPDSGAAGETEPADVGGTDGSGTESGGTGSADRGGH